MATASAEGVACRKCGRALRAERSSFRGVGPTCWRRMRAEIRADPDGASLPYDPRTGDLIVIVDKKGVIHANFPFSRREEAGGLAAWEMAPAMMVRAAYPREWIDDDRAIGRFVDFFVAPLLANGGGVVRGSELATWRWDGRGGRDD